MSDRLPLDQRFILQAHRYANEWGTCPRAKVGAIVVLDGQQVAYGYNGAPPKMPHCTAVGCIIKNGHCIRAIHAESNALWFAGQERTQGATLYATHFPCWECCKLIVRADIRRVVYDIEYRVDDEAMQMLRLAGLDVRRVEK